MDESNFIKSPNVVIACSGVDFCMIAGDNYTFKLNNNILFACAGPLPQSENPLDPVKECNAYTTLIEAIELTEDYMYNHLGSLMISPRSYILAGRDVDGIYYIISIGLNQEKHSINRKVLCPTNLNHRATLIALPKVFDEPDILKKYNQLLNDAAANSETLPDLYLGCAKIIRLVSSGCEKIQFQSIHD